MAVFMTTNFLHFSIVLRESAVYQSNAVSCSDLQTVGQACAELRRLLQAGATRWTLFYYVCM